MTLLADQDFHSFSRCFGSTSFKFKPATETLVALALVSFIGRGAGTMHASYAELLNARLDDISRTFPFDARFEIDVENGAIYLVRDFPLASLTFSDLLFALRRLERLASRWGSSERLTRLSRDAETGACETAVNHWSEVSI